MKTVKTTISDQRTALASPLVINGHELEFVQPLVPFISLSIMSFYGSKSDPEVFFFSKPVSVHEDHGFIFVFFQVTRELAANLLESKIDIFGFEEQASEVFFVTESVDKEKSFDELQAELFMKPPVGFDQLKTLSVHRKSDLEMVLDYRATRDAGLYKELLEVFGLKTS